MASVPILKAPTVRNSVFLKPFGGCFLRQLAAGLLCSRVGAFRNPAHADGHGRSLYGLMRRGSLIGSSLFYIALALATVRITFEVR